jgi:hypothetical protein
MLYKGVPSHEDSTSFPITRLRINVDVAQGARASIATLRNSEMSSFFTLVD